MNNIRQECLFPFEELVNLSETDKLICILDPIDLKPVVEKIKPKSNKGPTGYNPEAILRAFLVQQIEKIPTRADLVSKIDRSPYLRYVCGFSTTGRVPSESTFSRYYSKLSETDELEILMNNLLDQCIDFDLLDTETMAIDASKLEAYERAKPRSKIDKENSFTPDWGTKFDSHKNQITWYGWKIHAAVETKSELPIALTLTPANHADKTQAIPLVEKVNDFLAKRDLTKPKYWTMDSGYDYTDIYEHILFEQESQAIIPINKRNAKQPPAGFYDFKGTPVCSGGHKMYYWGHYKGVNKFRCPHVCGKVDCIHGTKWCSNSNYGRVTKTRPKENPRYISTPHRDSRTWRKIYNKRTSVERTFSRLKEHLNLENLTVMGTKKVKTHLLLSSISLIAARIAAEKIKLQNQVLAA
ncbi:transposase [Halanaerobium saccharolyticum]|nr:transposase [Halanaerobium saccharolyticum]